VISPEVLAELKRDRDSFKVISDPHGLINSVTITPAMFDAFIAAAEEVLNQQQLAAKWQEEAGFLKAEKREHFAARLTAEAQRDALAKAARYTLHDYLYYSRHRYEAGAARPDCALCAALAALEPKP
jgi:hypothetical protein